MPEIQFKANKSSSVNSNSQFSVPGKRLQGHQVLSTNGAPIVETRPAKKKKKTQSRSKKR
jgi:hypothetical protein